MRPNYCTTVAFVVILILAGVGSQAMPRSQFFCQDDFILTFGDVGQPLAAGTKINAEGRLLLWDSNTIAGWFSLTATANSVGRSENGMWDIVFDSGTFKVTSSPAGTTTYWQGDVANLRFTGYDNLSTHYSASSSSRPTYVSQPTEFLSIGSATFNRTGGTWTDPTLYMDSLGNYNWTYDKATPESSHSLVGNLQARLSAPEPGSLAALVCGLLGIAGCCRRKRV